MKLIQSTLGKIISLTTGLIFLTSFARSQDYNIGFNIISTYDATRIYKPNSIVTDKLHYRPIHIDVWYPADLTSTDTTVSFAELVRLFEQRSSFYDDTKNYSGLTEELLQYICGNTNCSDYNILKRIKTESYANARPASQQFPLVIYLSGFNGMSYENYQLFESLAKNGFVVASISSIGRYPGNMSMDSADLFQQIEDARFAIRNLRKEKFTSEEIGLIGYSWGGLAASILGMTKVDSIKAIVSLDGSEQFLYVDEEENEKLDQIRLSRFFKPNEINTSFLYLDSDFNPEDNLPDSIYNMIDFISGEKLYLKINHASHEDFSSLSVLLKGDSVETKYDIIRQLTVNYFIDKLKGQNIFIENIPSEMVKTKFSQPTLTSLSVNGRKLKGIVRDKKTNLPLPYVNLGILNKDKGTTTNTKGEFEMIIPETYMNDTLKISMVGYEPRIFPMNYILRNRKSNFNIALQEKVDALREVVVTEKKLNTKVLGNKTESKFFGGKFAPGDLGSEIAIKVKIKSQPTYLDKLSFNISYNSGEAATFRINIYEVKNGPPDTNILNENVILRVNGETGKMEVDLKKYNLMVNDDIFIALEWVEGKKNSGIVFSAGLTNRDTYYRKASHGRWRKNAMGVGLNITVKY